MRRWTIGIMVVLLLAACHRNREKAASDTVATGTVQEADDALAVVTVDTVATREPTQVYEVRRDTAEMTNLRILARKQRTIYSPSLMVGEWQRETLHELYYADGSGRSWDTKDDVGREEAQPFRWTMDSNLLLMEIPMEMGGILYRQYVVTFVDDETLVYRDRFDRSFMWDKATSPTQDCAMP